MLIVNVYHDDTTWLSSSADPPRKDDKLVSATSFQQTENLQRRHKEDDSSVPYPLSLSGLMISSCCTGFVREKETVAVPIFSLIGHTSC